MLPFDSTLEKGGRYFSEDQVSHSVEVKFNETDEHLKAIPRFTKPLPRGQENGGFTSQCLADVEFLFTAHSHLIVFSPWLIKNVTFGFSPFQDQ